MSERPTEPPRFRRHSVGAAVAIVPSPLRSQDSVQGNVETAGDLFILDPDGNYDFELNSLLGDVRFLQLAEGSRLNYADDLVAFLNFLWFSRRRTGWREAVSADREAYYKHRNTDPAGPLVAPSTWNREVASILYFFRVAISRGLVPRTQVRESPIPGEEMEVPHWAVAPTQAYRPNGHPEAFDFVGVDAYYYWRDVGLRGARGSRHAKRYRGRHSSRNRLFADLLVRTGLRLREASSLLLSDVPEVANDSDPTRSHVKCYLPVGIAKNQSARVFWVPSRLWAELRGYVRFGRRAAIKRARRRGAYDNVVPRFTTTSLSSATVVDGNGRRHAVRTLSSSERAEVWIRTGEGLEPAWLWLTERGFPMTPAGWQGIFVDANRRVRLAGGTVRCHPHLLRHLYATTQLLQLRQQNRLRASAGLPPVGDPLRIVQIRMGHRSVATTVRYLHAVQDDEAAAFASTVPDDWEEPVELGQEEVA